MQIIWLPSASEDIKDVISYCEPISEKVVASIILHIQASVQMLASFPEMGTIIEPDYRTRKLVVTKYNYVVVYKLERELIQIIQVFDTRQDPDKLRVI